MFSTDTLGELSQDFQKKTLKKYEVILGNISMAKQAKFSYGIFEETIKGNVEDVREKFAEETLGEFLNKFQEDVMEESLEGFFG